MKIYTSYYANYRNFPEGVVQVSIAGKAPEGFPGLEMKILAPKWDFFRQYKDGIIDAAEYTARYRSQVLGKLVQDDIINKLSELSFGKDVVLLCWEKPEDFCHRHIVADWLWVAAHTMERISELPNPKGKKK